MIVVVLALVVCPAVPAQVELDATVVSVNGDLILKSDILWNLALDPDVKVPEFWKPEIQERMRRTLVDQKLLLQEASKLPATRATDEEVQAEKAELNRRFEANGDEYRLMARTDLVGLTSERLEEILRDRLQILKFVDFRFRSFVVVTEPEVTAYFDAEVRPNFPEMTEAAAAAMLAKDRAQIEAALVEEKINNAIDVYLEDARARAEIVELN
jgi:hypothetical protein